MSISLSTRNKRIIQRYLAGELTADIAARYGITAARVSQIVAHVANRRAA